MLVNCIDEKGPREHKIMHRKAISSRARTDRLLKMNPAIELISVLSLHRGMCAQTHNNRCNILHVHPKITVAHLISTTSAHSCRHRLSQCFLYPNDVCSIFATTTKALSLRPLPHPLTNLLALPSLAYSPKVVPLPYSSHDCAPDPVLAAIALGRNAHQSRPSETHPTSHQNLASRTTSSNPATQHPLVVRAFLW